MRQAAYAAAIVFFLAGAVLSLADQQRLGVAGIGIAGAALVVALWASMRSVAASVARSQRALARRIDALQPTDPQTDPQVVAALHEITAGLRDLPVVAEQSVVATETLGRLDHALERLPGQLEQLSSSAVANLTAAELKAFSERLSGLQHPLGAEGTAANADARHRSVMNLLNRLETQLDQTPGLDLELGRLSTLLDPGELPLPLPGGWAVSPASLLAIVRDVLDGQAREAVVECGSGTSTVWLALALRRRGAGHVTAIEHDRHYADITRGQLAQLGLQEWATVLDAPLADVEVDGEMTRWYDSACLSRLPQRIDLLLVDGPPGDTGPHARKPAFPLLQDRLAAGAVVVLDDTDRPAEREIAVDWLAREGAHGRLVERQRVGRSTFYDVRPAGGTSVLGA
jgi:predicted O-methyltransferase YrrM